MREDVGPYRLWISDGKFAGCRIGQKLDVPDSLPQLIECRPATHKQSTGVRCRLDPARAAIEKPDAQGMLQVGDHLRHGWL